MLLCEQNHIIVINSEGPGLINMHFTCFCENVVQWGLFCMLMYLLPLKYNDLV